MRYAAIRQGRVDNVIECTGLSALKLETVMHCTLAPCEQYLVQVGDTYEDGVFLRDGQPIERIPTDSEKLSMLESENQALKERLEAAESATLGLMTMLAEV